MSAPHCPFSFRPLNFVLNFFFLALLLFCVSGLIVRIAVDGCIKVLHGPMSWIAAAASLSGETMFDTIIIIISIIIIYSVI